MTYLIELRELIRELLLTEANIVDFANAQIGRYGVIKFEPFETKTSIVVVSTTETQEANVSIHKPQSYIIPKVLGLVTASKQVSDAWRIVKMYAESAPVAVMLMAASLESLGKVYADYSVSPAAQQVIKRYFDKHKDDPTRVQIGADAIRDKHADEPEFLKAAYLGPVGFNMRAAVKQGELAVDPHLMNQDQEEVEDAILNVASMGFSSAYNSDVKTKREKKSSDVPSET